MHSLDAMKARAISLRRLPAELHVAAVLIAAAIVAAIFFTGDPNFRVLYQHLGAEYYNIARALADGRGFSDPFGEATGPTAWTTPLLPIIQCGLLLMLRDRDLVASAVLVLMHATFVGVGTAIYYVAKQTRSAIPPAYSVFAFVVWAFAYYYWFFILTSDVWLISAVATVVLLLASRYARTETLGRAWQWGVAGGVAFLTSPVVAACWAAILVRVFWQRARERKRVALAFLLAAYIASPWIVRNALVFHRFIPSKSNAAFELHQANIVDDDGIYDSESMQRHPYNQLAMKFDYGLLGETAYVQLHGKQFLSALAARPANYLERVENRLLAATLRYVPLVREKEGSAMALFRKILYALPCLSLLLCGIWRKRDRELVVVLCVFAGVFLTPYILIAFYERYLFPLTPILIVALFLAADHLFSWARGTRALPSDGSAPDAAALMPR